MTNTRYLTLAVTALLAASSQGALIWTTTFSGTNNTNDASRTITNTPAGTFTDTLTTTTSALTRNITGGNFFDQGANGFNSDVRTIAFWMKSSITQSETTPTMVSFRSPTGTASFH